MLADSLGSWEAFVSKLKDIDQCWGDKEKFQGKFRILEGRNSYVFTIRAAQLLMDRDWQSLSKAEAHVLLGMIDDQTDYGFLGSLRAAGWVKNVFLTATAENRQTRKIIRDAISSIPKEPLDSEFLGKVREAYETISGEKGFGTGSTTRLLTLARPDVLISVNSKSARKLAKQSGLKGARIKSSAGYGCLIEWVMKGGWWKGVRPETAPEQEYWDYRAALLDALVNENLKYFENNAHLVRS